MLDSPFLISLLLGIITILGLVFLYFQYQYTFWTGKNVTFLEPSFPFGNAQGLARTRSLADVIHTVYTAGKNAPVVGMWIFSRPILIAKDLDLIKTILVKEFSSFHDRGLPQLEKFDPLTGHLFFLNGQKWRNLRIKLTPTFTSGKMKMMFPTLLKSGEKLKKALNQPASEGQTVEVKNYLASFTTDVIASCAFGIDINAFENPDSEFRKMSSFIFRPSPLQAIKNNLTFTLPRISETLKLKAVPPSVTKFFLGAVNDTIQYREKNNVKGNDFMQLLIELINKGKIEDSEVYNHDDGEEFEDYDPTFTINQAAAQAFVFFNAGFETSSTAMQFCLYELAQNHEIQNKLREEMDRVIAKHNGQITYEGIQEMEYLDMVVCETLRKYPPAPILIRETTKNCWLPEANLALERGIRVMIPLRSIHHDPQYYPEPEKFDPERFTAEKKASRNPLTFMPFGDGPRICIGMRFALMQTKAGLVIFLSNCKVDVSEKTAIPLEFDPKPLLTAIKGGMYLKVTKR